MAVRQTYIELEENYKNLRKEHEELIDKYVVVFNKNENLKVSISTKKDCMRYTRAYIAKIEKELENDIEKNEL